MKENACCEHNILNEKRMCVTNITWRKENACHKHYKHEYEIIHTRLN